MPRKIEWDAVEGLRLWNQGMSAAQMAKQLGVDRQRILNYASRNHWPRRLAPRAPVRGEAVRLPCKGWKGKATDRDIQRYRREKRAREGREDAQMADARRLFLLLQEGMKPKRGRPKQSIGRAEHARKVA